MKTPRLSPLDQAIINLSSEFSKMPNYEEHMKDADLKHLHTFVAISISGLHDSKNLVANSFVPATNQMIAKNKQSINKSIFKSQLNLLQYDLDSFKHETIRLGYVFTFHKFEVFIKQLLLLLDNLSEDNTMSLEKYCQKRFDFYPTQWYKNKFVHLVNFISNCTKHQDGLCKLDNPTYSIPDEFIGYSSEEKIVRTVQQYKDDINNLIAAVGPLLNVITQINIFRISDYAFNNLGESDNLHDLGNRLLETNIKLKIYSYYNQ